MFINIGYCRESWKNGMKRPFFWDTDKVPHLLISGSTGGGKTVLAQLIVKQLLEGQKILLFVTSKLAAIGTVLLTIMRNIPAVMNY